jgi:hypothetical protein
VDVYFPAGVFDVDEGVETGKSDHQRLKAADGEESVIAALKRCATQK